MSNLVVFQQFDETIRQTPDGRFSVYDVIRFCGKGGSRKVWERLTISFPEVVTKCHRFKFPGRGQQLTPVTDREGILYIIGLLPGVVGRSYRESAARVFLQWLDADPDLAKSVIDRTDDEGRKEIRKHLDARNQGKMVRGDLTSTLAEHGVTRGPGINGYAQCTNAIYVPLLGGTAAQLKEAKGLSRTSSKLRDRMNTSELVQVAFAEHLAERKVEKQRLYGNEPCKGACYQAGQITREALDS